MQKFFTEVFEGVLITDFWAAYASVCAEDRQYCLVHLLRELEKVDLHNDSAEWKAFAKKLRRLIPSRCSRSPSVSLLLILNLPSLQQLLTRFVWQAMQIVN